MRQSFGRSGSARTERISTKHFSTPAAVSLPLPTRPARMAPRETAAASTSVNYVTLQTPTAAEQALATKYGTGYIPFIDVGNAYVEVGNLNPYGPQVLQGKSWSAIAAALSNPSSAIAQGALGSANYLTAAMCKLTSNQPATACTPAIQTLETQLAGLKATTGS